MEGGSQVWKLNQDRAKKCTWLVCIQNRRHPDDEVFDGTEPHGSAFLLGKVSGIRQSEEEGCEDRWLIAISEYTMINLPVGWGHGQNPVHYTTLEKLGISLDGIVFQPMPETDTTLTTQTMKLGDSQVPMLTSYTRSTFSVGAKGATVLLCGSALLFLLLCFHSMLTQKWDMVKSSPAHAQAII
jgi:hypothetical protein